MCGQDAVAIMHLKKLLTPSKLVQHLEAQLWQQGCPICSRKSQTQALREGLFPRVSHVHTDQSCALQLLEAVNGIRAPFLGSKRECSAVHLAAQLRRQGYIVQLRNAKPKECGKACGRTCLEKLQHTYILVTGSLDSAVTVRSSHTGTRSNLQQPPIPLERQTHCSLHAKAIFTGQTAGGSMPINPPPLLFEQNLISCLPEALMALLHHLRCECHVQMPVIVEPNFREHFSIASATPAYRRLLAATPGEFVGSVSRLAALVELLSEGVRGAFAEQGLPLPPWRRAKSVMSKWGMGPHAHGGPRSP